jgi:hypothetical protein
MTTPTPTPTRSPGTAPITVVSGLPRSGTSLLMQMLRAGGIEPLTDGARAADADNPRGYLELEAVKRIREDPRFLADAGGRAVKVIAQLLPFLPRGAAFVYRVIFIERDLDEVLASQRAMLDRLGRRGAELPPERLRAVFATQAGQAKEALRARADVRLVEVEHAAVLADPRATARVLADFLGGDLDVEAMAAAVDPDLHRQRRRSGPAG